MANAVPYRGWTQYLVWMLSTTVLTIVTVGTFNVLIDPLGVFNSPRISGLNTIKPYLDHHRELARWQAARRTCTSAAIFGNSRAEIGFDPEHPLFTERGLVAFNHAIPGTNVKMTYNQIHWLKAADCLPKTIILGVEFFDFLGGAQPRFPQNIEPDPKPRVDSRFLAETVFSVTGLRDSLATLLLQRARHPATLTNRGFNPLQNYISEVEQNGHYVLFHKKAEDNIRTWARKPKRLTPVNGGVSEDEQLLDAILTKTSEAKSTVHLVIYPYHAQIRLTLERLGLGKLFTEWKRKIYSLAARHANSGSKVEVWDFSGIGPETLEAIPDRGDRKTHLKYYWEAGHFKKALGDRVLSRIFGEEKSFGIKLEPANIDLWLAQDQASVHALIAAPSPMLAEVDDIVTNTSRINKP